MGTGLVGRSHVLVHARSLAADRTGVLFVGEPGVGKTRLLAEVLDLLESDGWHTERFVASTAARTVPFGALISLLPRGATDRTQQVAGVRRTLVDRADRRPTALAIDDAHLLDDASLACLVDLAHHSDVVVLGSARSTEPLPSDLTALWASEALDRGTNSSEKDSAMRAAVTDIAPQFVQCRGCGDWVCEQVCWNDSVGQCARCTPIQAEQLAQLQAQARQDQMREALRNTSLIDGVDVSQQSIPRCPSCQAQTTGGKFCGSCGSALAAVRACGGCQAQNPAGAVFCSECGGGLI